MDNPKEYCLACSRRYSPSDEVCANCGFDPVNDLDDAADYDEACDIYNKWLTTDEGKATKRQTS